MPRYFHFYGDTISRDEDGSDLASDDEAMRESVHSAGTTMRDLAARITADQPYRLECTDAEGETVLNIVFEATRAR